MVEDYQVQVCQVEEVPHPLVCLVLRVQHVQWELVVVVVMSLLRQVGEASEH